MELMIKAIVFDCFGVLIEDGLGIVDERFQPTREQWQEMNTFRARADSGLIDRYDIEREFARILNVEVSEVNQALSHLHKNYPLFNLVAKLKASNNKIGLISNVSAGFIDTYFSAIEQSLFDEMLLSYELGYGKPDRRIYEAMATKLSVETSECIFIDDVQSNVAGAKEVGMHGHVYTTLEGLEDYLSNLDVQFSS